LIKIMLGQNYGWIRWVYYDWPTVKCITDELCPIEK
jgi:hypothetical protein